MWICLWNINSEICCILNIVMTKCSQSHKVRSTTLTFYHIADCLLIEIWLCQHSDYQCSIFNQRNGSVFQLSCCICLRMDITDFFHLQAAFQTDCIINSSSYEKCVFCISLLCCEPLDSLFICNNLTDLIRNCLQLFNISCILFFRNLSTNLCKLNCKCISCDQLCAVSFCCSYRNLRSCQCIEYVVCFSCDRRSDHIYNTKCLNSLLLRFAECCKAICRLSGLADDNDQTFWI